MIGPGGVANARGYQQATAALQANSAAWRASAASTGMFEAGQIKVNSATAQYTELLQKQKLTFRDILKQQKVARAAYNEQLRMQNMVVRQMPGVWRGNKSVIDFAVPETAHQSWNTLGNRIGWVREQLRSASTQMINWGKNTQWAGRQLMVGFTVPVAAFGAATGALAYQMDKQLTRIAKVYDTTANSASTSLNEITKAENELAQVREASMNTARIAARQYGAALTDTLDVQAELAATGKRGAQLQESTLEVMRIATLGEFDRADALKTVIALQSVMGLNAEETAKQLNYMNSIENATSLATEDFAKAIPIALGPLKEMGGNVQDLALLLVAMKERGIEAAQGANAIKAMMQRLYRPSKQIREEWEKLTNTDITQIRDQNQGNIMGMLNDIADATENMDRATKVQTIGGLIGTYQVSRINAVLNGLRDLREGVGQTESVLEVNQKGWKSWAQTADIEIGRVQQSASGKFKIAVETIKVELAEMGEPFLEIGSKIIGSVTKIIQKFNDLPDGFKNVAAGAAILAALVGPVVMLTGLFANFAGNIVKFGVASTKALGSLEILNKENAAARLASRLAESGFISETSAIDNMTAHVKALNATLAESHMLMMNPGAGKRADRTRLDAASLATGYVGAGKRATGATGDVVRNSAMIAENNERSGKAMKVMAGSATVFGAAMAASLVSSNETVDNFANIAMFGSLAIPAVEGIIAGWKGVHSWVVKVGGASAALQTIWTATSTKMTSLAGLLTRGLPGIGIAITAVVGGYLAFKKATDAGVEKQERLNDSVKRWADRMGIVLQRSKDINKEQQKTISGMTILDASRAYREENPELVSQYLNASPGEQMDLLLSEYEKALSAGMDKTQIKEMLSSLIYIDEGTIEGTTDKLKQLENQVKSLGDNITAAAWSTRISEGVVEVGQAAAAAGTGIADQFFTAFSNMTAPGRASYFDKMTTAFEYSWSDVFNNIKDENEEMFNQMGINSGTQLQNMVRDYNKMSDGLIDENDFIRKWNIPLEEANNVMNNLNLNTLGVDSAARGLAAREQVIVRSIAEQAGIQEDIYNLEQLREALYARGLIGLTVEEANEKYKEWLRLNYMATDEQKLQALNYFRVQAGLDKTNQLSTLFAKNAKEGADAVGETAENTDKAKAATDRLTDAQRRLKREQKAMEQINWIDVYKTGIQDTQNELADIASENFQNRMDSAMEEYRRGQEARLDALQSDQERARNQMQRDHERDMRRFDNDWKDRIDRVTESFDNRVDAVNKAIRAEQKAEEIRKRIFDAEITRINRLAQTANSNIDFNLAIDSGELDEAAKIRNDMQAQEQEWALGDAAERRTNRSDAEVERLQERIDKIEEHKDARIKALEEIEDKEKRALERQQRREEKALDRQQKRQEDALQREVDNNIDAQEEIWDARKEQLDKAIELFRAFVPKNERELRNHIRRVSSQYKDFNVTTRGKFNETAVRIGEMLSRNVKESARTVKQDVRWAGIGNDIAREMIYGAFGMTPRQFKNWMVTGNWPDKAKPPTKREIREHNQRSDVNVGQTPRGRGTPLNSFVHTGGEIGVDRGGRGNIPHTAPMHRSEMNITAQKGEYLVNRKQAAKHKGVLQAINSGKYEHLGNDATGGFATSGWGMGIAGLMGAMIARAVTSTVGRGIQTGANNAFAMQQSYLAGKPGVYGERRFDKGQLKNAALIASVGRSMNMSTRDIRIAIMTAITESGLFNNPGGDRDSAGLFQQRPSMGWGTYAQVTDPKYAATKFYRELKGVENRDEMAPWMAAQTVQRSAYENGSNYRQYWNEAIAILSGLRRGSAGGGFMMGSGGKHRPIKGGRISQGLHDTSTGYPAYDIAAPVGKNIYAAMDGRVSISKDLRGYEPRNREQNGYRSYGRYIVINHNGIGGTLYAHLSSRYAREGQLVKGGSVIGRSGDTGHSSGPHLHFGATPMSPKTFLKKGAANINVEGLYNLHKNEGVLTEDLNKKFHQGVENFANGGNSVYNLNMNFNGNVDNKDEIARHVIKTIQRAEARKPQPRRGR